MKNYYLDFDTPKYKLPEVEPEPHPPSEPIRPLFPRNPNNRSAASALPDAKPMEQDPIYSHFVWILTLRLNRDKRRSQLANFLSEEGHTGRCIKCQSPMMVGWYVFVT